MSSSISCNDNQNYLVKQGRTTSRVLAPPGGFTSLSFGCEEPKPKAKEEAVPAPTVTVPVAMELVPAPVAKEVTEVDASEVVADAVALKEEAMPPKEVPVSANAFASGSNMNGAQVMTGRPTSRVLAPPGGHTTIKLW